MPDVTMQAQIHILLIDDDQSWLNALAEFLHSKGLSVLTAQGPIQGLEILSEHPVSLVVLDFRMPGMTGLEILRKLRKQGNKATVLVLSSEENPQLELEVLAEGAAAFLSKSLAPALIFQAFIRFLRMLEDQSQPALNDGSAAFPLMKLHRRDWLPVVYRENPFSTN
jgi:DNA-binding response OmpR family regulator